MKVFRWDTEKAEALRSDPARNGVSFEECVVAIESGRLLADIANPSERYRQQRMLIVNIDNYAYAVPYVETEDTIFLKTVFPSRKLTAIYLRLEP
jgi:hypothetical protein